MKPRSFDRFKTLGFVYLILGLFAITTIAPFLWMFFASFKSLPDVDKSSLLPPTWHAKNYAEVFHQIPFGMYYLNSFLVSAWVTFLTVLTSAMAAFAFARMHWKGRDAVFMMYLATMMIPGVVTMIPNYAIVVRLHLLDSYTGLIVPAAFSAFGTFLLRQFMIGIPKALDEAAFLDGAGPWTVFWDVIMPISKPGLAALAILTFLGNYGSFYWPMISIKTDSLRTLPIGMMYFDSNYGRATNLIMAAGMMSLIPPLLLFMIGQKQLLRGIQMGAVKG
ncbi:MAG TPA: carbohydrate ABC transporter permease [Fimbriimonadaceae bacterium]|jgi:ABC-type glycerol-3-phosphate transport system permease component